MTVTYVNQSPTGTFNYTVTILSTTSEGVATIEVSGLTDIAGNILSASVTDTFDITTNQITGSVELEDFVGSSRAVTFVATGGVTKTWTQTLSFTVGVASYTLIDVPDGTTGLSAKADWNLRVKLATPLTDGQGTANFIDNDKLRGGDLNGSNSTNIQDYAVLKNNWFTTNAVADINGDGKVTLPDFLLLKQNWFQRGDGQ